jgi:hypothetical protein
MPCSFQIAAKIGAMRSRYVTMNTTREVLIRQWLRHRLRIAVTVLCLVACVTLIRFWVRSYYSPSRMHVFTRHTYIQSWKGELTVNPHLINTGSAMRFVASGTIPYWVVVLLVLTLAALPWVQWSRRYSLRAFLIITTLIAVLFGAIAISY